MSIDGMLVGDMVMPGTPITGLFIAGMGMPIIIPIEGRQRSSNCSKLGREVEQQPGIRRTHFDKTAAIR
jgi:hypothetical protein